MAKTTIEFSDHASSQLDQLGSNLQRTKAEILRDALSLYVYIVNQLQEQPGRILGIVNEKQENRIEKLIAVPGVPLGQTMNAGKSTSR